MLREIGAMNTFLLAIDGKNGRTYGVPCSQTMVGEQDYTEALRASGIVRYVRTGGAGDGMIADPSKLDPFRVPSRMFSTERSWSGSHGVRGGCAEKRWDGRIYVPWRRWGLSQRLGGHAPGIDGIFETHEDEIWVGTFQEVMDFVKGATRP